MQITKRSILAISIAALLSACGSDDSGNSGAPVKPEPLKPQPAQTVDVVIGNANVKAMKESLVITTAEGKEKLGSVESFKGITFAEAARFDHSNTVDFSGDIDATQFGDACPQIKATTQAQSEDCLNLNIWRPVGTVQGEDLPVYVFIHGGDFEYGSGANPMIHGDKVVAQGADEGNPFIAVTFNYRLGLLGTRWVKGANVNGNYGLGDQETLLKWVQDNIQDFGGNAANVTLMGQGSGAMSIELLQQKVAMGELEASTFHRAIMQSVPYGFEYPSYNARKARYDNLDLGNLPTSGTEEELKESLKEILNVQKEKIHSPIATIESWLLTNMGGVLQQICSAPDLSDPIKVICLGLGISSDNNVGIEEIHTDIETEDLINYLLDKKDYILNAGKTPNSVFMPFAPYLECAKTSIFGSCNTDKEQPALSKFQVPTVLGANAEESNTTAMLPSLTFLVPMILKNLPESIDLESPEETLTGMLSLFADASNKQQLEDTINSTLIEIAEAGEEPTLDLTAYGTVTQLFLGLSNIEQNSQLLGLTDFYANNEGDIGGAIANMKQFKAMINDLFFTGPARLKASNSNYNDTTFYYFDHSPSFNIWTYNTGQNGETNYFDLLKSISCISGACNGSELPFVFNKAVKMDGTEVHPSSSDKQLMNEMSRLWFSDELFNNYQYNASTDSVLVIDQDGQIKTQEDWDMLNNEAIDPKLRNGRLQGLENMGLIGHYLIP